MNSVLLPRLYSIYGRRSVLASHRLISVTCCRNQQAPKVKSEKLEKVKKAAPTPKQAAAPKEDEKSELALTPANVTASTTVVSDAASEKPVFQENTSAFPPPTAEGQPETYSPKILRLTDEIANLTLLEVADLNKALKKKLNLPDTPMFAAGSFAAAPAAVAEEEDTAPAVAAAKSKFSVKMTKIDDSKKIAIIKEVKSIVPNLNLVQAKKFVESLPQTVKGDILKDEAEKLVAQLTALGAVCEID